MTNSEKTKEQLLEMSRSTIASLRMEGFLVGKETENELKQLALGEVATEDYIKAVLADVAKMKQEKPGLFGGRE